MSSLKINFKPSASGCQMPNGPTRDGPQRFCMWATTLRSSNVVYATAVSSTKTASSDLDQRNQDVRSNAHVAISSQLSAVS